MRWNVTTLDWKDSYSVGNEKMDDQHKGLIALINRLEDGRETDEILEKLQQYVDAHFREEETLLESVDYPQLSEQKEQHATFEEWLASQKEVFSSGVGTDKLREGVQGYLKAWLVNHILFTDKAYASYLK